MQNKRQRNLRTTVIISREQGEQPALTAVVTELWLAEHTGHASVSPSHLSGTPDTRASKSDDRFASHWKSTNHISLRWKPEVPVTLTQSEDLTSSGFIITLNVTEAALLQGSFLSWDSDRLFHVLVLHQMSRSHFISPISCTTTRLTSPPLRQHQLLPVGLNLPIAVTFTFHSKTDLSAFILKSWM